MIILLMIMATALTLLEEIDWLETLEVFTGIASCMKG
ncbi:hypothetical protein SDC9_110556 [bioreactor metagenome]|uniref:Uncharacterized protein n=1 Tax=bioreactor metagenome TaxID=1076179 RepID=A0A645BE04_9ZZZZ